MPTDATLTARHADTASRLLFGVEAPETTLPRPLLGVNRCGTTSRFRRGADLVISRAEPEFGAVPADLPNATTVNDLTGSPSGRDEPADLERRIEPAQAGSREAPGRLPEACRDYLLLVANRRLPADRRAKAGASDLVQQTWPRQVLPHNLANTTRHFRATGEREPGREVALADAPARELVGGVIRWRSYERLPFAEVGPQAVGAGRRGAEARPGVAR
jgi:hypothetical protein